MMCEWFAMCKNEATTNVPHPILGTVPTCDRCCTKMDLEGTTLGEVSSEDWEWDETPLEISNQMIFLEEKTKRKGFKIEKKIKETEIVHDLWGHGHRVRKSMVVPLTMTLCEFTSLSGPVWCRDQDLKRPSRKKVLQ
jgi:hypothetical protein